MVRGDDVDATILHERYIVETGDCVGGRAPAGRIQELARQDRDIPVDPGDPDGVVADRADRAGNVRAVKVIVHRIARVGDRIDPVAVVHVPVVIVVETVVVTLGWIHPDVGGQVDVVVIHTGVEDCDHYIGAAGGDVPGRECADVRPRGRRAAQLPGVIEGPLMWEERIVRGGSGPHDEVRLDVLDARLLRELRRHHVGTHACRGDHVMKTGYRDEGPLYVE